MLLGSTLRTRPWRRCSKTCPSSLLALLRCSAAKSSLRPWVPWLLATRQPRLWTCKNDNNTLKWKQTKITSNVHFFNVSQTLFFYLLFISLHCWLLNDLLGVMKHVIARQITLALLGQTFSISFDVLSSKLPSTIRKPYSKDTLSHWEEQNG